MNVDSKLKGCLFCQNEKLKVVIEDKVNHVFVDVLRVKKGENK